MHPQIVLFNYLKEADLTAIADSGSPPQVLILCTYLAMCISLGSDTWIQVTVPVLFSHFLFPQQVSVKVLISDMKFDSVALMAKFSDSIN